MGFGVTSCKLQAELPTAAVQPHSSLQLPVLRARALLSRMTVDVGDEVGVRALGLRVWGSGLKGSGPGSFAEFRKVSRSFEKSFGEAVLLTFVIISSCRDLRV